MVYQLAGITLGSGDHTRMVQCVCITPDSLLGAITLCDGGIAPT